MTAIWTSALVFIALTSAVPAPASAERAQDADPQFVFAGFVDGQQVDLYMATAAGEESRYADTPEDEVSPAMAPDGERIAFVRRDGSYDDFGYTPTEVVVSGGSSLSERTLSSGWHDEDPVWSPSGEHLVFERMRKKDHSIELMLVDVATGELTRLTRNRADDTDPTWAPSSKRIAYIRETHRETELRVVSLVRGSDRLVAGGKRLTAEPAWSPRADRVAYIASGGGPWDVFVVDVSSSETTRLTRTSPTEHQPQWSPDGELLGFFAGEPQARLFVMTVSDKRLEAVSGDLGSTTSFAWAPDSDRLVYLRGSNETDVVVVELSTGDTKSWSNGLIESDLDWAYSQTQPG